MRTLLFPALFLISTFGFGQTTYTAESVPNEKLVTGTYVSNPDSLISFETAGEIDRILRRLEDSTTTQVAVVLLESIGDAEADDFSQQLFDRWKIGQAGKDNGLLILYVEDKRVIWFNTGYGVEGILPDVVCKRIQMEKMVPYFRDGNVDDGMLEGIKTVSLLLTDPSAAETFAASDFEDEYIPLYNLTFWIIAGWIIVVLIVFIVKSKRKTFAVTGKLAAVPEARFTSGGWILWYLILPVVLMTGLTMIDDALFFFGGMYLWTGASIMVRRNLMDQEAAKWVINKDYHAVYNFYQQEKGLFSAMRFLFPLPFAFIFGRYKRRMQFFRDHPRDCKQCGKPLSKLNEKADDAFLSKEQLLEESIKSVDYDVWKCSSCNAADKLNYVNKESKYDSCPKCKVRAYYSVSNSVIRAATTSSSGIGEEVHSCKFCNTRDVRRYTIAKIERSSSSSSGSSSSGGSWGGGRSGGGGAGSSW